MSGNPSGGGAIPPWLAPYWNELRHILDSDKQRMVLQAILETDAGVLSATELAEDVEQRLDDAGLLEENDRGYETQNLNQILPRFECLGIIQRIPKFDRSAPPNEQYTIIPTGIMCDWLGDCNLRPQYDRSVFPIDRDVDKLGQYVTESWGEYVGDGGQAVSAAGGHSAGNQGGFDALELPPVEEIEAGQIISPAGALFSRLDPHVVGPEPADLRLGIGSLEMVRQQVPVDDLVVDLELGTTLPGPDDAFTGDDGVHEYAIFGEVDNIASINDDDQLKQCLRQVMATWLASSKELYTRAHAEEEDVEVGPSELAHATGQLARLPTVDAALDRHGRDIVIIDPDEEDPGRVVFGLYHRDKP